GQGFRREGGFQQGGQQRPYGDRQQSGDRNGQGFRREGGFQQGGQQRPLQGFMDKDKDAPRQDRRPSGQRQKSSSSFEMPVIMQKPGQGQKQSNKQHAEKKEQQMTSKGRMLIQQGGSKPSSSAKKRNEAKKEVVETAKAIEVALPITIGELASLLDLKPGDILRKLLENGRMLAINHSLDKELIYFIMDLFELEHDKIVFMEDIESDEEEDDDPDSLEARPPVVTILGHVDHGKTSLLDAIRKTNVTAGEAGGITQKIGAYVVNHDGKKIVFVDTPGHEAFTAMRARGAQVTDIAILVVAADDGVMPQTIEAINHAKAAKVPIIVAINKIDKPGANIDRVKQQLADQGLTPDDWGGDATCVPVSAKSKIGLDDLLDMILLVADMQELKANPKRRAYGIILESRLDKGLGCMATVLVQKGTLKPGDAVIAGLVSGKVRLLINENGEKLKKATPSIPVEIVGLTDLPNAGDVLMAVKDDKMARQISDERQTRDRERHLVSGPKTTLQDIFKGLSEGEKKELDVLIKADSNGSVEAIKHSLAKLPDDEVKVNIVHGAVGSVSESDVLLAKTSAHPLIIGFNIKVESNIRKLAEQEKVNIRTYDVIYHMIEDIQAAMKGMLEPEYEQVLIGKAEVRQIFKASKVGVIAGSCVISGKIARNSEVKIYRKNKMIHEGEIESLKRFKDDAKEVLEGFECGISIENFNDLQEGDIIEAYQLKEKER
ncbi:MAG: translation initiation factor IF-2, partial [bacterium]|nr:translation initiation factor IF-2 [bacterium]